MKTIEELYKEILASDELKKQCTEAVKDGKLGDFLKVNDCAATADEVKAFLNAKKEVGVDELDSTAGGCNMGEAIISVCSVGVACAVDAIVSAATTGGDYGDGRLLCDM